MRAAAIHSFTGCPVRPCGPFFSVRYTPASALLRSEIPVTSSAALLKLSKLPGNNNLVAVMALPLAAAILGLRYLLGRGGIHCCPVIGGGQLAVPVFGAVASGARHPRNSGVELINRLRRRGLYLMKVVAHVHTERTKPSIPLDHWTVRRREWIHSG